MTSRILRLMAAAGLALVLATRVFTSFTSERAKVVQSPLTAVAGSVVVPLARASEQKKIAPPAAVIARIHNDGDAARAFTLQVDGRVVCRADVPARATKRVDCESPSGWEGMQRTTVSTDDPAARWTLEYLEFATHHGATQAYDLVIVPAGATGFTGVHGLALAIVSCLLVALFLVPGYLPRRFYLVAVHRVLSAIVALFLVLVVISPFISAYLLLISAHAFFWYVVLLAAPRVWFVAETASAWIRTTGRTSLALGTIATVVVAACYGLVFAHRVSDEYGGNISGVLHISRALFDKDPLLNTRDDIRQTLAFNEGNGYDGEFMYFQMYDPFLRAFKDHPATYREYIDAGPYRFDRVGYPLLAKTLAFGRWQFYPAAMVLLVLGSIVLCAGLIAVLAAEMGHSALWGLAIVAVPGFWQSLQRGLPEPLAAALLIGGYLAIRRRSLAAAAVLFAASLLVRETGVFFVIAVAAFALPMVSVRARGWFLACAIAPMLLWRAYVGLMLMADWGPSVFVYHPDDFGAPLAGIVQLWSTVAHRPFGPGTDAAYWASIAYPVLLMCAAGLATLAAFTAWGAPAAAAVAYAAMALCLNFESIWVDLVSAQRGTYELFVMLLMATLHMRSSRRPLSVIAGSFWISAAIYVFFLGFDAPYIRESLRL